MTASGIGQDGVVGPQAVFVLRQSPDWEGFAADHARGLRVDPARYVPPFHIPAFPSQIERCIARWNAVFAMDFFSCRAELRLIARTTLDAVANGIVLTQADLPHRLPRGNYRLFFLDDDDWFAPDTSERLIRVGDEDVAVFPLLRLDVPLLTFIRQWTFLSPVIGLPNRFSHRYQTNNYALHPRICVPETLSAMSDHMSASDAADRLGLRDVYHETLLSVTNKSPASASVIIRILEEETRFRSHVAAFVATLRGLMLPPHARWLREPIARTAELFARALG